MPGRPAVAPEGLLTTKQVSERLGYTRQHVLYLGREGEGQSDTSLFLIGEPIRRPGRKLRLWQWPEKNVDAFKAGPVYRSRMPSLPEAA